MTKEPAKPTRWERRRQRWDKYRASKRPDIDARIASTKVERPFPPVQPIIDSLITCGIWPDDPKEGAGIVKRSREDAGTSWGADDDHENLKKIFFKVYGLNYDEVVQ